MSRSIPYRAKEFPSRTYYGRPGRDGTLGEICARIPRARVRYAMRGLGWEYRRAPGWSGWWNRKLPHGIRLPAGPAPLKDERTRAWLVAMLALAEDVDEWVIYDTLGVDWPPS